ncbi:helix-turn-helix domain-containing protein [Brenneria tiliae]
MYGEDISLSEISRRVVVSKSTVSREVRRDGTTEEFRQQQLNR